MISTIMKSFSSICVALHQIVAFLQFGICFAAIELSSSCTLFRSPNFKKMIHKISDGSRSLNHPSVGWANNIPTNFPCGWTNPFEKICSSNWIMSPRFAVNIKKYLVTILMSNNPGSAGFAWRYLKPPPLGLGLRLPGTPRTRNRWPYQIWLRDRLL